MNPVPPQNAAPPSTQDLNNAYADLLGDLNDAYWAAGTLAAKDQIKGVIDEVTAAVTALDATDITNRDAAYNALVSQVSDVNKQLANLQKQISGIISRINTANSVISDVTKVLAEATKLFPGI